jgi:hypothetical protein
MAGGTMKPVTMTSKTFKPLLVVLSYATKVQLYPNTG